MLKIFTNFCCDTNLHGFVYIAQPSSHRIEKIFWIIAITTSCILTGILIFKLIIENQTNPVVIYTDKNAINVQDIHFPSLSFCPGILLKNMPVPFKYAEIKKKLENLELELTNLTSTDQKMMQVVSLIANDRFMSNRYPNVTIPTDDFIEILNKFGVLAGLPTYSVSKLNFYFRGNWTNKYPMNLTNTLWKTGICYTFNFPNSTQMFNMESISNDFIHQKVAIIGSSFNNVSEYTAELTYPLKSPSPGKGLFIEFTEMQKTVNNYWSDYLENSVPQRNYNGLKLFFHGPFEALSNDVVVLHARKKSFIKIVVNPKISNIDDTLTYMEANERLCYLENERQLKFFKVYNKINCEHECAANFTLAICKCVQFFMVRDKNTRICGTTDENCFRNVEEQIHENKTSCNCYEKCNTIKYDIKMM